MRLQAYGTVAMLHRSREADVLCGALNLCVVLQEDAVLEQELSTDEMDAVAGGNACPQGQNVVTSPINDGNSCSLTQQANCFLEEHRSIYNGSFPNCAATVEDGSWCSSNDACHTSNAIRYTGMNDCSKAWK